VTPLRVLHPSQDAPRSLCARAKPAPGDEAGKVIYEVNYVLNSCQNPFSDACVVSVTYIFAQRVLWEVCGKSTWNKSCVG